MKSEEAKVCVKALHKRQTHFGSYILAKVVEYDRNASAVVPIRGSDVRLYCLKTSEVVNVVETRW